MSLKLQIKAPAQTFREKNTKMLISWYEGLYLSSWNFLLIINGPKDILKNYSRNKKRILSKLTHPNVVCWRLYGVGCMVYTVCIIMSVLCISHAADCLLCGSNLIEYCSTYSIENYSKLYFSSLQYSMHTTLQGWVGKKGMKIFTKNALKDDI